MRDAVVTDRIAPPAGPFSPAVRHGGSVYVSGQVGRDPTTGTLVDGGVGPQTAQLFRNLEAILVAAGKSFEDVIKANVYLVDMGDSSAMNAVYASHFTAPYPARTTIAVAALPLGAAVEIEVLAR